MEDTASTATDQNQNELGTELTDEQMTQFVDEQIGPQPTVNTKIGWGNPDDAPVTTPKPADDKPAGDEKSEEDKAKEEADAKAKEEADAKAKEEEDARKAEEDAKAKASAEIPDVDTSDLWIEVDAYILEGEGDEAKPVEKTVRIALDAGEIPDAVRFKNDKQLMEVLDALQEMRQIRTARQDEHDKAIAEKEKSESEAARQSEVLAGWDQEIEDMTAAGILEAPKAKPKGPDGYTAEEIAADPALEKIDNVFKFMTTENEKRVKEGKTVIGSFGTAYNLYMKQSTAKTDEEKAKADAELTKKRGAMVGGGSSAGAGSSKPDKVYRAGSAKSIWAVPTDDL